MLNPGYLAAVKENELGGRFNDVVEEHTGHWGWYAVKLLTVRFWPWSLLWVASIIGIAFSADRRLQRLTLFSTLFCLVHIIVISSAQTKLEWYDLPVYPLAALTAAIGVYLAAASLHRFVMKHIPPLRAREQSLLVAIAVLALIPFVVPYRDTLRRVLNHELNWWDPPFETYATEYLQQMHRGVRPAQIDAFVWKDYYASIAWYRSLIYGLRDSVESTPLDSLQPGQRVFTFQPKVQSSLTARFAADTVERYKDSVVVYRITARR
jgi:hypothetical protein